jgi:hypothetical protein
MLEMPLRDGRGYLTYDESELCLSDIFRGVDDCQALPIPRFDRSKYVYETNNLQPEFFDDIELARLLRDSNADKVLRCKLLHLICFM